MGAAFTTFVMLFISERSKVLRQFGSVTPHGTKFPEICSPRRYPNMEIREANWIRHHGTRRSNF